MRVSTSIRCAFAGTVLTVAMTVPSIARAQETLTAISQAKAPHLLQFAVQGEMGIGLRQLPSDDMNAHGSVVRSRMPFYGAAGFGVTLAYAGSHESRLVTLVGASYLSTLGAKIQEIASDESHVDRKSRYQDADFRLGAGLRLKSKGLRFVIGPFVGFRLTRFFAPVVTIYDNHLRAGPEVGAFIGFSDASERFYLQARPDISFLGQGADLKRSAPASGSRTEWGARIELGLRMGGGFGMHAFLQERHATGGKTGGFRVVGIGAYFTPRV